LRIRPARASAAAARNRAPAVAARNRAPAVAALNIFAPAVPAERAAGGILYARRIKLQL
jgi:hypothetical protein